MKQYKNELSFIIRMVLVIGIASVLSFGVLYLFMNEWVGKDYRTAFQVVSGMYQKMNYYIIAAVLLQLVMSCIVVYFFALHYSHKVAGPMYRLKLTVQRFLKGEEVENVTFRKTDFLHGVADNFTDFFFFLGRRRKLLDDARALVSKVDLSNEEEKTEALKKIEDIIDDLQH